MPDVVSRRHGGKVLMATSIDPSHPGDNVLDGSDHTFWISTGLYPQEILFGLARPSRISNVHLSSTHVRGVRIEGCLEDKPVSFTTIAEAELADAHGQMQVQEIRCRDLRIAVEYIKLVILSGWHDFCTIHRISVDGEFAQAGGLTVGENTNTRKPSKSNVLLAKRQIAHKEEATEDTNSRHFMARGSTGNLEIEIPLHTLERYADAEPDAPRVPADVGAWSSPREDAPGGAARQRRRSTTLGPQPPS